ncbi:hypothetical protein ACFQ9Z_37690 [Streptomyces sp. NPDC056580]|uniref:hypothetical protein n=1 Tax=Streptomyces sp. NPDC056580 TaxID=3345872 RepID=UPI00367C987C
MAATASARVLEPVGVLVAAPGRAADCLPGLPVQALYGIGSRQTDVLHDYGIHTAGLLAAAPAQTVQRLLGGRAGRLARERARGADRRPVVPRSLPASATVSCTFARHTLDGADVRAALLDLVIQLGRTLRRRGQSPQALTLTFTETGLHARRRPARRRLPAHGCRGPAARTPDRAVPSGGVRDADTVAQQITLDHSHEAHLVAEAAVDRSRDKAARPVIEAHISRTDREQTACPRPAHGRRPRRGEAGDGMR